ncbi:hypothetical protein GT755_29520 [Herbidospora sp. NEAU-GS84]|uniref:SnoaL-like domain-containing protein n=1 Tax=Herbidospora solisilvae TaxID=2696284 RepID=A0A7C9JBI1_9ACTN|nr:hypothetical protein [Herbidospora solisilvae]NAS25808.1 hypothetical protein [Herbidospora solisilvae]
MLRDLVDAYAPDAHRRDLVQQAHIFTDDARVTLFDGKPGVHPPTQEVQGMRASSRRPTGRRDEEPAERFQVADAARGRRARGGALSLLF